MFLKNLVHMMRLKSNDELDHDNQLEEDSAIRSELTNIIKIFFNFTYYLGFSPFRFVRDVGGKGYFVKKTWRPQQVICAFLHILQLFGIVACWLHKSPPSTNPIEYFKMFNTIFGNLYMLVTMKRFWLNSQDYMNVINGILKKTNLGVRGKWITKPGFLYSFFGLFTVKAIVSMGCEYLVVFPISEWTSSKWITGILVDGRDTFSFLLPSDESTTDVQLSRVSVLDCFLALLRLSMNYVNYMFVEFADLCILMFAWTLWVAANSFALEIEEHMKWDGNGPNLTICTSEKSRFKQLQMKPEAGNSEVWHTIYRNFQAAQNLSELVNAAMGYQVTWYLGFDLMYYSINMNTLFISESIFETFQKLIYFAESCYKLYIAADICEQMKSAKDWLTRKDNRKSVPAYEARLVMHDDVAEDIGIRPGSMFTITYPFVAEYISLMVTFFIITIEDSVEEDA